MNHRDILLRLREGFSQPTSNPVHDGYVAFSFLRAFDQVDKLKSEAPFLGKLTKPDYAAARQNVLAAEIQSLESVVPQLIEYLEGMLHWGHPRNQVNVVPPPTLASLIGSMLASSLNPNLCTDETSRKFSEVEVRIQAMISKMVGYDAEESAGLFTFGGTGTMLYAARVGLEKALPGSFHQGLSEEAVVLGSDVGHYAGHTISAWLGIGQNNFLAAPSDRSNSVDVEAMEELAREALSSGKHIAMIVATLGTTDAFGIDDLQAIAEMRDRLVEEFNLTYRPHIHADAVIGWAWTVFNNYSFDENPLDFRPSTLRSLAFAQSQISSTIHLADSLGIDFHKTAYVPYVSSLVLFRDAQDLQSIARDRDKMPYLFHSGERHPGIYTLETSRSAIGPMTALASLLMLGSEGLQTLIGHAVDMSTLLREKIGSREHLTTLNDQNHGPVTIFRAYPSSVDTFRIKEIEFEDPTSAEMVRKHNEFNRRILARVSEQAYHGEGIAISSTACYRKTACGEPMLGLKSYILSPFCSEAEIDLVVQQVSVASQAIEAEESQTELYE